MTKTKLLKYDSYKLSKSQEKKIFTFLKQTKKLFNCKCSSFNCKKTRLLILKNILDLDLKFTEETILLRCL